MDPKQALGEAVREKRWARGLSQERLAELAGLHRTYIGGIEQGRRNVSLINICRIAGALGCRPIDLFRSVDAIAPTKT